MKMKTVIAGILICTSLVAQAQNEKKGNVKYANITEWGFLGSPSELYFSFEGTTVHGFSVNGHVIGLGLGIGIGNDNYESGVYCPLFINYRYYFTPENKFSPHINVALGGISRTNNLGIYSTLTTGFRSNKFSFSSGVFFQAYQRETDTWDYYLNENYVDYEMAYPWGIIIKVGFTF